MPGSQDLALQQETDQRLKLEVFKRDPLAFVLYYDLWKPKVSPNPGWHDEWLQLAAEGQNLIMKAPKDFGKSTVFSFCFPIWLLCMMPDIRIIIASDTHTQAVRRTRAIKRELEGNRLLIRDFGMFQPRRGRDVWTDEEFTINQRLQKSLIDPTIRALGMGDAVEGARADAIIGDDICSLENQGTPERRKKVSDWFFQPLLGCREKWTPVYLVGTT